MVHDHRLKRVTNKELTGNLNNAHLLEVSETSPESVASIPCHHTLS
jgi:hypothetical protein